MRRKVETDRCYFSICQEKHVAITKELKAAHRAYDRAAQKVIDVEEKHLLSAAAVNQEHAAIKENNKIVPLGSR